MYECMYVLYETQHTGNAKCSFYAMLFISCTSTMCIEISQKSATLMISHAAHMSLKCCMLGWTVVLVSSYQSYARIEEGRKGVKGRRGVLGGYI